MNRTYIKAKHDASRLFRGAPQFLDLKQLADLENEFRLHCRTVLKFYRGWRHSHENAVDPIERHYRHLEGQLLRRQAIDAVRLYTIIRKDMRRSFRKYIVAALDTKF